MSASENERGVRNNTKLPLRLYSGWSWFPSNPNQRTVAYALLLTILASACCFFRLSEGTLFGDEAAFACTTDRMLASGDWVVPCITDKPHLNATPLYNWLTLTVAPWSNGTALWYRFWSALFGVGCVLVGFAIGAYLFRPEVGLLAGVLLALNRGFLFGHGIRFGGMDAMLTFFVSGAALCYVRLLIRPSCSWMGWCFLGSCIGLACLSKPPVFGGYFFVLIVIHWLVFGRRESFAVRIVGPFLAMTFAVLIASPWYVLLWSRLGNSCLHTLFVFNSVERALDPTERNYLCCHDAIWHTSTSFKFMEVAMLCAVACWFVKNHRAKWGPLLFVVGGYLLALTAAGKAFQYIYYPFPLLAVLVAGLFLESGPRLVAWFRPRLARPVAYFGVGLAISLVASDCAFTLHILRRPPWTHPPVAIYERFAPELAQGTCRIVLFDFPKVDGTSATGRDADNFEDLYYLRRMPLADRVQDVRELNCLLEDGKPTVVILPPLTAPQPDLGGLCPDVRIEENGWRSYTYPVLSFHGAAASVPPFVLARLARGGQ
jgi:4-amino-4-deoxy-L-arabinose transferase-like glycosyltransferase